MVKEQNIITLDLSNLNNNKVIFTTVSDDRSGRKNGKYSETQDKILQFFKNNPAFGVNNFSFWKFDDIVNTDFYKNNKTLLDHTDPAFNGRCYKPFVIRDALDKIEFGDFVIYNDVSPEWWESFIDTKTINAQIFDINIIKNLCIQNGSILTAEATWYVNGRFYDHTHENYTLDRCINYMNLQEYKYSLQHASGMIVLQKCQKSIDFVDEWLKYNLIDECCSLGNISQDTPNFWTEELYNNGKFGHRHDQSISGLLLNKINNKLVKSVSNYNFLSFCRKDYNYTFIDSVKQPSECYLKNTLINDKWVAVLLKR